MFDPVFAAYKKNNLVHQSLLISVLPADIALDLAVMIPSQMFREIPERQMYGIWSAMFPDKPSAATQKTGRKAWMKCRYLPMPAMSYGNSE